MTDYKTRIDELWEDLLSLDVDDEGWRKRASGQLEEVFAIARALLKERDGLARPMKIHLDTGEPGTVIVVASESICWKPDRLGKTDGT